MIRGGKRMNYTRICPNCGAKISIGEENAQNFCSTCGQNLWNTNNYGAGSFNLITAYKSMFKKYAQFRGRSRRSEYWYAGLANFIVVMLLYLLFIPAFVDVANYGDISNSSIVYMGIASMLITIYGAIILVPSMALAVRRLHDIGKSGWFLLIGLIPYIGSIIIFVFMVLDSQPAENEYGPNPKGVY